MIDVVDDSYLEKSFLIIVSAIYIERVERLGMLMEKKMDHTMAQDRRENSKKPKLLILPGMVCNERSWTEQFQALIADIDCHIVDYGLHNSMPKMAAHIYKQHMNDCFMIMGHSMGARVAMELYHLAPNQVKGMCLISTEHLAAPDGEKGKLESLNRQRLLQIAEEKGMTEMAKSWLPHLIPETRQSDALLTDEIIKMISEHSIMQLASHINAGSTRTDSTEILKSINVPTLLIVGDRDVVRPVSIHQQMAELVTDSQLLIIPDVGHLPTMEAPQQVNYAVKTWVHKCLTDFWK